MWSHRLACVVCACVECEERLILIQLKITYTDRSTHDWRVLVCLVTGLCTVRARLRISNTEQRLSGAQAGHQDPEKGPETRHVGGQNQFADQKDHLSRTAGDVRHPKGVCRIVVKDSWCQQWDQADQKSINNQQLFEAEKFSVFEEITKLQPKLFLSCCVKKNLNDDYPYSMCT